MNEEWFNNINWSGVCVQCREQHQGKCPKMDCARLHYDANGNKIPLYAWHADGNTLDKYTRM